MADTKTIHGFVVTRAEGLTASQRENNRIWVEERIERTYVAGRTKQEARDA